MSCEAGPFSVGSGLWLRALAPATDEKIIFRICTKFVQVLVILINIDW